MIYEKLVSLISRQCMADEDELNEDTLLSDIGADEIDINEIAQAVKDEFDVELDDGEINDIETIGDFVEVLENAIGITGGDDENDEEEI